MIKKVIILIVLGVIVFGAGSVYGADAIRLVVNGKEIKSDTPAQIVNDRTMVPVRFVAEALGAKVDWDANSRTVLFDMPSTINDDIWPDPYTYDGYVSPDVTVSEYVAIIRNRNLEGVRLLSTLDDPDYDIASNNDSDFSLTGHGLPASYTMSHSIVTHFEFIDGRNAPSEMLEEKDRANGGWQIRGKVYYEARANPADYYTQIVDFIVVRRPAGWQINETPFVIRNILDVGEPIKINNLVGPFPGYKAPY